MRIRALTVVIIGLLAVVAFGAFVYFSPPWISPEDRLAEFVRLDKEDTAAKDALTQFLAALHDKRYADAVKLYDGSYETLQSWNPLIGANDYVALWRNGCEQNGLNCLAVSALEVADRTPAGTYVINAWFVDASGQGFSVLSQVGGGNDDDIPRRNVFPFTVVQSSDGAYRVQTMPVYTP